MMERLLRLPEVEYITGLRRSAIYGRISKGTFPRPIRLTARAVAWPESSVEEWVAARIRESREPAGGAA